MNILIPIGGIGKRFTDEGYSVPKPLIKVLGKSMIHKVLESIKIGTDDIVHIVYNPELNFWNFKAQIKKEFPQVNFRFVQLEKQTRGAAETILFGLDGLNDLSLSERFLILDCDTFYSDDVLGKFRSGPETNKIFYFEDTDYKPIFSYIKFDHNSKIYDIKEKVKISDFASTGAYGFRNGNVLKKYCSDLLNKEGELYVSRVYEEMISQGEDVEAEKILNFDCVGTPLQLKVYCERNKPTQKVRFCFDLDNTLVSFPTIPNDYTSVLPLQKNIDYLKFLKSQGSHIIIYTARRMKTHKGNVGAIVADIGKITLETLEKFEIPYDEIFFGKPHADFYIDDLGVNAFAHLDREIGFYNTHSEARSFNSVEIEKDTVTKFTSNKGEIFWYENIPDEIKGMCPSLIESDLEKGYLKIERLKGVNLSYLYTNYALKPEDVDSILDTMRTFHQICPSDTSNIKSSGNYTKKIQDRFNENIEVYKKFPESEKIYFELLSRLEKYESGISTICLIHGDPVFSNIIMTDKGLKFIDPRGKVGDSLSIYGDVNYDLAKIYQSILGYDFILNDVEINFEYERRMRSSFEKQFSSERLKCIKLITASLFFSLIPLHIFSEKKFTKYFSIIKSLLECL